MKKNKKTLYFFAIIYTAVTIYLIVKAKRDEPSAALVYVFLFFAFWIVGGIILGLLFWLTKIKIKTIIDKITLVFSTPLPMLVFSFLSYSESPQSTYEFSKDGRRHRKVEYTYNNYQTKRIEYYISQDSVTEENPFPENDIWLKDSIWIFYNKDGTIEREERH